MTGRHPLPGGMAVGLLALGVALAAPARAENPRVNLRLEKVTAGEAVARLTAASGVKLGIHQPLGQPPPPLPPLLLERADFDWTHATLGRALRELAARYSLRPNRDPGGSYTLFSAFGLPAPPPAKPVGLVDQDGARLFARAAQVYASRSVSFTQDQQDFTSGNLVLQLGCILREGDAEAVARFRGLSAMDDLGNLLLPDNDALQGAGTSIGFPDEWIGSITLRSPALAAKKLAWVEGDLVVYRRFKPTLLEVPLPADGKPVRCQVGDVTVVLSRLPAAPPEEVAADLAELPVELPPAQARRPEHRFRLRTYVPTLSSMRARGGDAWNVQPLVVDSAGRPLYPRRTEVSTQGFADGRLSTAVFSCQSDDPPTKLLLEFVEAGDPVLLTHFRMKDIPLPAAPVEVPGRRPNPPPPLPGPAPGADRPYHQPGGAALNSPVTLQGKPAPPGTLSVGLARKEGDRFSSIRWLQANVGDDGRARLEDLQPGTYRILRVYRASDPAHRLPSTGRWQSSEVTLTLTAGKETPLPPLQWLPPAR